VSWYSPGQQQRNMQSLYCPSPRWGGEENQKKVAKLMGQGKDSLTEWLRMLTVATTLLIRRVYKSKGIHRATLSHRSVPNALPSHDSPPASQLPHSAPSMTAHGMEYPICLGSLGQPSLLCPLLASCEN